MADKNSRKPVYELSICRFSSDKFTLIKEKVKSLGDFADVLLDARLNEEEITSAFGILGDAEIVSLIRRHPIKSPFEDWIYPNLNRTCDYI